MFFLFTAITIHQVIGKFLQFHCFKFVSKQLVSFMHQSIPAAPSSPPLTRATAGHLPAFSVPGVGHLQILRCPVAGLLPNPGLFRSFWNARGFLSEYYYTEDITGKKADWLICQGRGCKGMFSILCMHFFIAFQASRITERNSGAINVNQRFLVSESNLCIWRTSFHIYKTIHNI